MSEITRKLASVRKVLNIEPIKDADKIELITVDGWKVVTQKGLYSVGDLVAYFEVDSFLPIRPEYEFLRPSSFRTDPLLGEGFRIKTAKLRGQISQGLLFPLKEMPQLYGFASFKEGDDLTEILGVRKWEPVILCEDAKGPFPSFIPKTDQERYQNLVAMLPEWSNIGFEVSEKLEGQSFTAYLKDGVFGVCSRNLEMKEDSKLYKVAEKLKLKEKLEGYMAPNMALQGELVGPGIQGNLYSLKELDVYFFDVYSINEARYLNDIEKMLVLAALRLKAVPELTINKLEKIDLTDFSWKSRINPSVNPEGMVLKSFDRSISFKSINPEYLLKQKD